MPELREVAGGWLYYGEVVLNLRRIGRSLEFRVKETWLRPSYGEHLLIPIGELVELIDENARQDEQKMVQCNQQPNQSREP